MGDSRAVSPNGEGMSGAEVICLVDIGSLNDEYKRNASALRIALKRLGMENPFPWDDLWSWYGHYSPSMPTYKERRTYIGDKRSAVIALLENMESSRGLHDVGSTGEATWENLDFRIAGLLNEMTLARDKDAWQDSGRRSREILIDLGKLVADSAYVAPGNDVPKTGDARAWLGLFLTVQASGSDHKELRSFIRSSWDLAQKVTHGDISRVDAFAASQATVLLARVIQQLHAGS
jgi:hypothetical protein